MWYECTVVLQPLLTLPLDGNRVENPLPKILGRAKAHPRPQRGPFPLFAGIVCPERFKGSGVGPPSGGTRGGSFLLFSSLLFSSPLRPFHFAHFLSMSLNAVATEITLIFQPVSPFNLV